MEVSSTPLSHGRSRLPGEIGACLEALQPNPLGESAKNVYLEWGPKQTGPDKFDI